MFVHLNAVMESLMPYHSFTQFLHIAEILWKIVLGCSIATFIIIWLRREKKSTKTLGFSVPRLRLRPYNPYGNLSYLPTPLTMKKAGFPVMSYLLQNVAGNRQIFQKEGIFGFRMAFKKSVLLAKAEFVEKFLGSNHFLEKADLYDMLHPWLGSGLLTSYGSKWKTRRRLLTPAFHFDILKEFVPVFDEQSKVLVDILKKRAHEKWIDIVQPITLCSLDIICETTLGVHVGAQLNSGFEYVQAVLNASHALTDRYTSPILRFDTIFWLTSVGRRFKKALKCLHGFTRKVIQEKKDALQSKGITSQNSATVLGERSKSKRKALMDLLLDVHMNHEELAEEDIREEIDTFAFEGHDTTSTGMSWALYLIGLHHEVQSQIHQELDGIFGDDRERPVTTDDLRDMHYLERVLKESLRLYPPVQFFGRKISEDFDLCGYKIDKGVTVFVNVFVLHRNPDAFPNPEKFDPDRFLPENSAHRNPYAYIPFSAGSRNCIGQRFALMEEKTVVANILRNFQVKSLDQRDILLPAPDLVLRASRPMRLQFIPRDNCF